MREPNDLPLVCIPTELCDADAAQLVEFLHALTAVIERHYCAQLRRYYHATDYTGCDLDRATPPTEPPF
jgi:hypothetical protein